MPLIIETSRPQRQLGSLLRRAIVAEDRTQTRLELDIIVPIVVFERLEYTLIATDSGSRTHPEV